MKQSVWNKRVPGLFIFFLLIVGFITASFVAKTNTNPFSHASANPEPIDMQITNLTPQGFTISYRTNDATTGTISYGQGTNTTIVFDDRDTSAARNYKMHYFTLHKLSPGTQYHFIILSDSTTYKNNGAPFTITTPKTIAPIFTPQIIQGNVVFPSGADQEAILYATSSAGQTISALVSSQGKYTFDAGSMLNKTSDGYVVPTMTSLHILIVGDGIQTTTDLPTAQSQIVPSLVLGGAYDFSQISPTTEATTSAVPFPTVTLQKTVQKKVQILNPEQGQAFSDQQPVFTGTAAPKTKVSIIIHSDNEVTASVQTDSLGNWTYTPSADLAAGKHTITITATDAFGIVQTISSTFYVYASGGNFLVPSVATTETPSPSVTIAVSDTPTLTPTPTVSASPSAAVTPTLVVSATATPTILPTETDTPTLFPTQFIAQTSITITGTPITGSNSATTTALIALVPVILGGLLIYLSKGVIR